MAGEFTFYLGVDWATEYHRMCILDSDGHLIRQQKIEDNGKAITDFIASIGELAQGQLDRIAVAIEVPRGPIVEAFLEHRSGGFRNQPENMGFRLGSTGLAERMMWKGKKARQNDHTESTDDLMEGKGPPGSRGLTNLSAAR